MDYHWKDIYSEFSEAQNATVSERDFQYRINSIFKYYLRWGNNIVAEESIHIGSAHSIRPDFVLYKDEVPQVVIEAKKPVHSQTERNREQLYSYMRQKKVDFGLYIGECIQLYYDNPDDKEFPCLVFTLHYQDETNFGDEFVNMFAYNLFNETDLRDFCAKRIVEQEVEVQIEAERNALLQGRSGDKIMTIIKQDYISKGLPEKWVDKLFDGIDIAFVNRPHSTEQPTTIDIAMGTDTHFVHVERESNSNKKSGGRQKFSINGKGQYYKNGCALELVRLYVEANPMPYLEIKRFFDAKIRNLVLSKDEVMRKASMSFDKSKTKRWHEDSPLVSTDGVTFYVTTQVGSNCPIDFEDILLVAKQLGYNIEAIDNR